MSLARLSIGILKLDTTTVGEMVYDVFLDCCGDNARDRSVAYSSAGVDLAFEGASDEPSAGALGDGGSITWC